MTVLPGVTTFLDKVVMHLFVEAIMAFKELTDGRGKIYLPVKNGNKNKHPCPDCFACQGCSDDRCALCRGKLNDVSSDRCNLENREPGRSRPR